MKRLAVENPGTGGHQTMTSTGNININCPTKITQIQTSNNMPSKIDSLIFELPGLPVYDIVGRDSDVEKLMNLFKKDNKKVGVCAMGGMGKTTLSIYCAHVLQGKCTNASQFAKQFEGNPFFKNVIYFTVENRKNFEASVKRLAELLNINQNQSISVILNYILQLYKGTNLLIIFDNLIKITDVSDLLLSIDSENLYVIATSQNRKLKPHFHIYNLDLLSEEDGLNLFLSAIKRIIAENNIKTVGDDIKLAYKKLHELVQGLPISLAHAASWIAENIDDQLNTKRFNFESVTNLIQTYVKTINDRLKQDFPEQFETRLDKTVYLALSLNIDKLTRSGSKKLLFMLSHVDPVNIEEYMFNALFEEDDLNSALVELTKFSIIHIQNNLWGIWSNLIRIHRLVHQIARTRKDLESECIMYMGSLIIRLSCWYGGSRHLQFIIENLIDKSNLSHWINLSTKKEIQLTINKIFELHVNWILKYYEDVGCNIADVINWSFFHKYMSVLGCYNEIVLNAIFEIFKDECLSDAEDGITLHHTAAVNLRIRGGNIFEYLVRKGIDLNKTTTKQHLSPLHVVKGEEAAEQLVSLGLDPNMRDIDDNTALHTACITSSYGVGEVLLKQPNVQLDAVNKRNETPLQIAVDQSFNHANVIVSGLLEAGARYDFRWENGETILHRAVRTNKDDLITWVVDRIKFDGQISVDDVNQDGDTAVHIVISRKHYDDGKLIPSDDIIKILAILVDADANLQIKNNQGHTPLSLAQEIKQSDEVIDFLILKILFPIMSIS